MKQLQLSAIITTSVVVTLDAFTLLPRGRSSPHTLPSHTRPTFKLDSTVIYEPSCVSIAAQSLSKHKSSELISFLGSDRKNRFSSRVSNNISRYGGRTSTCQVDKTAIEENGIENTGKAVLGFDLGLNMVSRSVDSMNSDWTTEFDEESARNAYNSIVDISQSNTSPIKKQIVSSMQSKSPAPMNSNGKSSATKHQNQRNDVKNPSSVPGWFPYVPTRRQIETLKAIELRDACTERGLRKNGRKIHLQKRLIEWSTCQHRRRVLERNAMRTHGGESPLQDAINNALSGSLITTPSKRKEGRGGNDGNEPTKTDEINLDSVEPLINRRKKLLHSKRFSFSKSKGPLGFTTDSISSDVDDEDDTIGNDHFQPTKDYLTGLKKTFDMNVDTTPNNYQVKQLYQKAKHADQSGDYESAKIYLLKLRKVTPRDTRVIRRLARLEMQEGKFHKAREILQSGLREMPKSSDILQGLGKLEVLCGNVQSARKHFRDAIALSPRFPNPYHALATLEHSHGHIRVATTILRRGLKHCPSNHRLYHALGDLYREAKMLDMAEKTYHKGLKCIAEGATQTGKNLEWGKSFLYTALGYVSYEKGDIDECRKWLRKSIGGQNSMHSQGWLGLAQLEESERNLDNVRSVYKEALAFYESKRRIYKFRTSSKSIVERKTMMPPKPGDRWIDVYTSWAKLEANNGDCHAANNAYSRAAAAFPKDWHNLLSWAKFQVNEGQPDRARTLFELACDNAGSHDAEPYRCYAEFEMSSGNYRRARSILFLGAQSLSESSDGTRPNDEFARLYHSWALCEWHLGNFDRTEILFDHSLRLIESGAKGSLNRSLVLYSIARFLFHARNDSIVAQHCICLSLSENHSVSDSPGVWQLWANVAHAMSNPDLKEQCIAQAEELLSMDNESSSFPVYIYELGVHQMLRKSPWQQKSPSCPKESWYKGVSFPHTEISTSFAK